jgi:hypothetical protein
LITSTALPLLKFPEFLLDIAAARDNGVEIVSEKLRKN